MGADAGLGLEDTAVANVVGCADAGGSVVEGAGVVEASVEASVEATLPEPQTDCPPSPVYTICATVN